MSVQQSGIRSFMNISSRRGAIGTGGVDNPWSWPHSIVHPSGSGRGYGPALLDVAVDVYRGSVYDKEVIRSFRDAESEKVFQQRFSRQFQAIEKIAIRKLFHLNRATTLRDLAAIPGDRLEALKGDRKGQYSVRINDQYRICFRWKDGDAFDVEIADYH
jgi:proteic killer suppression protein